MGTVSFKSRVERIQQNVVNIIVWIRKWKLQEQL